MYIPLRNVKTTSVEHVNAKYFVNKKTLAGVSSPLWQTDTKFQLIFISIYELKVDYVTGCECFIYGTKYLNR